MRWCNLSPSKNTKPPGGICTEPGTRARVNLSLREGEAAPPLRYGQKVEFDARLRKSRRWIFGVDGQSGGTGPIRGFPTWNLDLSHQRC